ncbi:MAG: MFS transporter, partial [Burkholderiales bacterium]
PTVVLALSVEWNRPYSELLPLALGGFIAFGAGSIPAGWIADRWSRFGMMVIFFVGLGVATAVTGLAQTPSQIAICLTFVGLFAAIYHPVGIAMLVANTPKVGSVLGINGVYGNAGLAFAALIAGALAQWWSWRAAFVLPGLASIVIGFVFWSVGSKMSLANPVAKAGGAKLPRSVLVRIFCVLVVSTMAGGIIFSATTIAMPKVFDERLNGLTNSTFGIGVLVCITYLIAAMAQLLVGNLLDRMPLKRIFVPVAVAQVPLLALAASTQNVMMLVVAVAMMFVVFGQIPINDAMVARYTAEEWRARAYSVRYVMSFGASACAVPLVAWAHRAYGDFNILFFLLAGVAVLLSIASFAFPGKEASAVR